MEKQKSRVICRILFIITGTLTVLEFLFVRGMFTGPIALLVTVCTGGLNLALSLYDRRFLDAATVLLASVALCMGYFVLGGR